MQRSALFTILFSLSVSVVASVVVATSAVVLKERQEANKLLDMRLKVLDVAGLIEPGEKLSDEEVNRRFEESIRAIAVDLESGEPHPDVDATTYDQRAAAQDPATSMGAPDNNAGVARLPAVGLVYQVVRDGSVQSLILPIEGRGLWSTLYGFIALTGDLRGVEGITFYEHGETAGLGGEVENPRWRALWRGRTAFDESWQPRIRVIKGAAGPPEVDPFDVDGLAGATITGNGVTNLVQFWLGEAGYGPYLRAYREENGIT